MSLPEVRSEAREVEGLELAKLWTVSNALSALRVVVVPPTLYYIWLGSEFRWYVFWLVMVMVFSDILDGALARARNEVTEWGKIIDPIADKLAIDTIAALLVVLKGLPVWGGRSSDWTRYPDRSRRRADGLTDQGSPVVKCLGKGDNVCYGSSAPDICHGL